MKSATKQRNKNVVTVEKLLEHKKIPKALRDAAGLLSYRAKKNLSELKKMRAEWDTQTEKLEKLLRR